MLLHLQPVLQAERHALSWDLAAETLAINNRTYRKVPIKCLKEFGIYLGKECYQKLQLKMESVCQNVTFVPLFKKLLEAALRLVLLCWSRHLFVQCSNSFNTICCVLRVARNMSDVVWRWVCVELVIYGKFCRIAQILWDRNSLNTNASLCVHS